MDFRRVVLAVALITLTFGAAVPAQAFGSSVAQAQESPGEDSSGSDWVESDGNASDSSDGSEGSDAAAQAEETGDDEEEDKGVIGKARSMLSGANPAKAILSPGEAAEEVWERLKELFAKGMRILVDDVFNEALGTPTINNDGAFGIFGTPTALEEGDMTTSRDTAEEYDVAASESYVEIYNEVYLGIVIPMVASIMFLVATLTLIAPAITAMTRRQVGSVFASAVVMLFIVVGSWEFATILHAASDAVAQLFLPTGEQVLNTNVTTFSGPLAVAIGVYLQGWVFAVVLAAIHAARHVLLYVYPVVLPVFILMAYWGGHRRVKQVGSFFIWQWYALLVMNIPTAVLLSVARAMDWAFFPWELLNFLATIAIFGIAVAIPMAVCGSFFLIGLTMRGVVSGTASATLSKHAQLPRPSSTFGGSAARRAKDRLKPGGSNRSISPNLRERAASARSRAADFRNSRSSSNVRTDGSGKTSRVRSSTYGSGITPNQRNQAASNRLSRAQRTKTHNKQVQRAREDRSSYRKTQPNRGD